MSITTAAGLDKAELPSDAEKGLGGASRSPTSDDESLEVVDDNVADPGRQNQTPAGLPFSKGRCIALVITVTGAAFLNVSAVSCL